MSIHFFNVLKSYSYPPLLKFIIPLLAIIFATGCQQMQQDRVDMGQVTAIDTTAIIASIDNLRSSYQDAVNNGNMEALGALVTEDAKMVQPGTPEWDAMREAAMGPFPAGATITITPMETQVLSRDWAYDMGSSTLTYTPEGSNEAITLRDTYLVLLKRTADGWKVHREVASALQLSDEMGE